MKKKLKKLAPVAVAGLVLASAGTMEAQAIEELDPELESGEKTEEEKETTSAPTTEINEATPSGDPPTTEGSGEEEGSTSQDYVLNLDVDTDGDEATYDGHLKVETTPGESSTENVPDGDPTVSTVTNPDGSSTTTTTQPTKDINKEESDINISGNVTPAQKGEPSDEAKEEVKDEVQGELKDAFNEDGTINWENVPEKYDVSNQTSNPDGSKTTTIKFSTTSESESKPLTGTELGKILGVTLEVVEGEDGTYTYTNSDGATVTVKVTNDSSAETATTEWTVVVVEKTTEANGSEEIESKTEESITNGKEVNVTTILNQAKDLDEDLVEKDDDGRIIKVTIDNKTYTFDYGEYEEASSKNLTTDQIFSLFLNGKDGYSLEDGKIYKNVDGTDRELTFEEVQEIVFTASIKMTVVDTQGGVNDPTNVGSQSAAEEAAKKDAVLAAVKAANSNLPNNVEPTLNADGSYTVTFTVDGKSYSYKVSVSTSEESGELEITGIENLKDGTTTTVTGSAFVTGETIVWGGTETLTKTDLVTYDSVSGSISFKSSVGDKLDGLGTVTSIVTEGNKTTVTFVDGKTTTVYTFTVESLENLTEDQMKEILGLDDVSNITVDGISQISWTVQTKTDSTKTDTVDNTFTSDANLTVGKDGSYTYVDGNDTVVFENGKTSVTLGNATYTLEKNQVSLSGLTADKIAAILGADYSDVKVENGVITATYEGKEVTIDADETYTKVTVKKTVSSDTKTEVGNTLQDLIDNIIEEIGKLKDNEALYVNDRLLTIVDGKLHLQDGDYDVEITEKNIRTEFAVAEGANFGTLDDDDLENLLNALWEAEKGTQVYKDKEHAFTTTTWAHFEIGVNADMSQVVTDEDGKTLTTTDSQGHTVVVTEPVVGGGILLPPDENTEIFIYKTAEDLVKKQNGKEIKGLNTVPKQNEANDGVWEYQDPGKEIGNSNAPDLVDYHFYSVKGSIAYNFILDGNGNRLGFNTKTAAEQALKSQNINGGGVFQIGDKWYAYQSTALLNVSGYMAGPNCAGSGYDLVLNSLTLTPEGTVIATGANESYYSANLVKKATSTLLADGASLHVSTHTTGVEDTFKETDKGSDLAGMWTATQTKTESDFNVEKDADGKVTGSDASGEGTGKYSSYQTYKETKNIYNNAGTLSYTQYTGSAITTDEQTQKTLLNYKYQAPDGFDISVSGETSLKRVIDATLTSTAVSEAPGDPTVSTVVTPAPETPAPEIPDETPELPPTDTTVTPAPAPTPGAGGGGAAPAAPVTQITDEVTPLADIADEVVPLADAEDLVAPLAEIEDEIVPLADIEDEIAPLAEIPDLGGTPLAEAPHTGDSVLMQAIAAMSSGLSATWLLLNRKRRS